MYSLLYCLPLGMFCVSRDGIYFRLWHSFVCSGNIFSRGKEEVAKGDALLCATVFFESLSRVFAAWRGARAMFKVLPVIFRGVSAYLYRPRFCFYIASHRYAPRGTPARRAILSHDKRAINFCETAPSRLASTFYACTLHAHVPLRPPSSRSYVVAFTGSARETSVVFLHKGIVISRHLENAYLPVGKY